MRQRNVQQQNKATLEELRHHAMHWRGRRLPDALLQTASAQGIDCEASILLKLEIDFPGMPRLFGMLLTSDERFISFEIETDPSHSKVEFVEAWRDVTNEQNLSEHNPGAGIGTGALAIQVLRELSA